MPATQTCIRCRLSLPLNHFVGIRGAPVKRCASCRNRAPVETTPLAPRTLRSSRLSSRRRSLSPLTPLSTSSDRTIRSPAAFASAVSVSALEERFDRLEHRLDSQLGELLNAVRAVQAPSPARATQPAPQAPPQAPPAVASAPPAAGSQPVTAGESPPLSLTRCFAWVPADIVSLVERDQLKPEHLVKLRNPESRVSKEPARPSGFTLEAGQLTLVEETADSRTSAFVKAIPNVAALSQVWLVYTAIRVRHTGSVDLNDALLAHLEHLIECDHLYIWRAVADYHLAVCRKRFGTSAVQEWASYDPHISSRVLYPFLKPAPSSISTRGGPSSSSRPQHTSRPGRPTRATATTASEPCNRFNAGIACAGCTRLHTCIHCKGAHPLTQCSTFVGKHPANAPVKKAA